MLDAISNALVLFSDPIFLTFYANWRTGRSKRSSNKAAGKSKPQAYPLGYVEDVVEAENADREGTRLGAPGVGRV